MGPIGKGRVVIGDVHVERAVAAIGNGNGHGIEGLVVLDTVSGGDTRGHEFLDLVGIGPGLGARVVDAKARLRVGLHLIEIVGDGCKAYVAISRAGLLVDDGMFRVARVGELEVEHVGLEVLALEHLGSRDRGRAGSAVLVGEGAGAHGVAGGLEAVHGNDRDGARVVLLEGNRDGLGGAVVRHAVGVLGRRVLRDCVDEGLLVEAVLGAGGIVAAAGHEVLLRKAQRSEVDAAVGRIGGRAQRVAVRVIEREGELSVFKLAALKDLLGRDRHGARGFVAVLEGNGVNSRANAVRGLLLGIRGRDIQRAVTGIGDGHERGVDRRVVGVARMARRLILRDRVGKGALGLVVGARGACRDVAHVVRVGHAVERPARGGLALGIGGVGKAHAVGVLGFVRDGPIDGVSAGPGDDLVGNARRHGIFVADFLPEEGVPKLDIAPAHAARDVIFDGGLGRQRRAIDPAGVFLFSGFDREAELPAVKRAAGKRLRGRGRPGGVRAVEVREGDALEGNARAVKPGFLAVAKGKARARRSCRIDRGVLGAHIECLVIGVPQHLDHNLRDAGVVGDGSAVARGAVGRVLHDLVGEGVPVDVAMGGVVGRIDRVLVRVIPLPDRGLFLLGGAGIAHTLLVQVGQRVNDGAKAHVCLDGLVGSHDIRIRHDRGGREHAVVAQLDRHRRAILGGQHEGKGIAAADEAAAVEVFHGGKRHGRHRVAVREGVGDIAVFDGPLRGVGVDGNGLRILDEAPAVCSVVPLVELVAGTVGNREGLALGQLKAVVVAILGNADALRKLQREREGVGFEGDLLGRGAAFDRNVVCLGILAV